MARLSVVSLFLVSLLMAAHNFKELALPAGIDVPPGALDHTKRPRDASDAGM